MINRMNKIGGTLLIGATVLSLAACGNEDSPPPGTAPVSTSQADASASGATRAPQYATLFSDSVFLGDSITEGLSYHDVLEEANVLAGAGKTAEFALEDIKELAQRKPKHVFIHLGSDDILWPTDNPQEYSLKHYAALIGAIKDKLPQATITLLSVTPVTAEAEEKDPRYRNIEAYNQGLRELADKKNVGFVDLAGTVTGNPELYDADGIHFKAEFYPRMLELLADRVK
jgi:hypothetical protein